MEGKMKGRKERQKDERKERKTEGRKNAFKEENNYGTKKSKEYRGGI